MPDSTTLRPSQKDVLFPVQRLQAYGKGLPVDRLPCVPIVGNTAARVLGVSVSSLRNNGKILADAHIAAYRRFGYDNIRVFTDLYTIAEGMGAQIRVPEDETAFLGESAIQSISGIASLRPVNPYRDGVLPEHIEAIKRVVQEVGSEVPVTAALTGPFTNASFLIGAVNLSRLVLKDPASVHHLCQLSLDSALAFAEAIFEAGGTPSLTDAMSSSSVISPKQFEEFSYPYLKVLADYIHAKGKTVTLHICGKTSPIWDKMADTGADCLSIDNDANLLDAKNKIGHRIRLMGNVHPSAIMLQGTHQEIRREVYKCVAAAYDNPKGFVVASGCSLPTETPLENIDAMLDAVREIGYPVSAELKEEIANNPLQ
ncbi:MAG: uroporphyrinogen decarboxylase family protein [Chlorobiales bacterium]|nr:uroporphyrinogen decarboxylase family protein [Chlorobiales bacterium]